MNPNPQSQTEHLSIAELLGAVRIYDHLPEGWIHPKAIDQIEIGSKVYVKNLKSRDWELGKVEDYWELGDFLEVRCGKRLQKVFCTENIGVRV